MWPEKNVNNIAKKLRSLWRLNCSTCFACGVCLLRAPLNSFLRPFLFHHLLRLNRMQTIFYEWTPPRDISVSITRPFHQQLLSYFVWISNLFFIDEIDIKSVELTSLGVWNNSVTVYAGRCRIDRRRRLLVMCALCVDNDGRITESSFIWRVLELPKCYINTSLLLQMLHK